MIIKLSESKRSTYEQCPKKYYYQYIERPKVPKKIWDHFETGLMAHKTLELFHQKWTSIHQDKIRILIECAKEAQKIYNTNLEIAQNVLNWANEYVLALEEPPHIVPNGIEKSFLVPISEVVKLSGRIDRIDMIAPNYYRVVDYKTGQKKPDDIFQLKIYSYVVHKLFPDAKEPITASYIMLRDNSRCDYNFSFNDLQAVPETMNKVAMQIKQEQHWSANPSKLCYWCDYRHICKDAM
jgi:RecB family exonuclease